MTHPVTFQDLQLIEPIARAVRDEGYTQPTPIQQAAIPHVLAKRDLLGLAQTGTGKTAAFALPILQRLAESGRRPSGDRPIAVLVLTPTRELASQIGDSFAAYGRHLGFRHSVIFGGVSQKNQERELRTGIDVLIATPGRLLDLASQRVVHLNKLEIFVLDEADRMLDMGFVHDVRRVISLLPPKRQTLFFSATMPPEAQKLADLLLHDPATVAVTPVSSTVETIASGSTTSRRATSGRCSRTCSRSAASRARWSSLAPSTAPTGWSSTSIARASRPTRSMATSRRTRVSAPSSDSRAGSHGSWWPPTLRPAGSISITSLT
jgi:superfamily II DNA/RNA helicase